MESALTSVFGQSTMKAVEFYVDRHIVLSSPSEYAGSMRKLFGEPANLLLKKIIEGISNGAGLDSNTFSTLEECVAQARAKLG